LEDDQFISKLEVIHLMALDRTNRELTPRLGIAPEASRMPFKILIADDNINDPHDEISRLPEMLQAAGYEVVTTADGVEVYDLALECKPDLVLLDIHFKNQPVNGFEICEALRDNDPDTPIIFITVPMTDIEDILRGFNAGADDYVIRPRDNREIIARIRANLPPEGLIVDNYLCVDLAGFQVFIRRAENWQNVRLRSHQLFELLKVLIVHAGLVVPTTVLKNKVWGDKLVSDDVLAVYIHRLRKAIEPDPANPVYIETIKGLGYRFDGKPIHGSWRS
jgi:two-component system, OmpR family, alkaline phosphatase synthesis response regulator PhoP